MLGLLESRLLVISGTVLCRCAKQLVCGRRKRLHSTGDKIWNLWCGCVYRRPTVSSVSQVQTHRIVGRVRTDCVLWQQITSRLIYKFIAASYSGKQYQFSCGTQNHRNRTRVRQRRRMENAFVNDCDGCELCFTQEAGRYKLNAMDERTRTAVDDNGDRDIATSCSDWQ